MNVQVLAEYNSYNCAERILNLFPECYIENASFNTLSSTITNMDLNLVVTTRAW